MPIKGLTSREDLERKVTKQLETAGKITKGLPRTEQQLAKNQPGQELDYFLFRLKSKYDTPQMRAAIAEEFGEKPKVLRPVFVVGRDYEEAFPTNMERWGTSGLSIRCDGEQQLEWWDEEHGEMSHICKACIAPRCGCQRNGRLFIVLPTLAKRTGVYVQFMLQTHSARDTENISAKLLWAEGLGIKLYQIPFVLEREPGEVKIPLKDKETGKYYRGKSTKYFVTISVEPGFVKQIDAPQYTALPASVSIQAPGKQETTRVPWATKETVDRLLKRAAEGLGLGSADVEGFTEFPVTDYIRWNQDFDSITSAANYLKQCLDDVIEVQGEVVEQPPQAEAANETEDMDSSPSEADDQRGDVIAEALAGHKLSVNDMTLESDGSFRVAIVMGVTAGDVKAVKKIDGLEYVKHDTEYIWVKLKGE